MPVDVGRRIRAAAALGDYDSIRALAQAVDLAGFGEKTINRVLYGQRPLKPHEAEAIARACDINPAFFTADLSQPPEAPDEDAVTRVEERIEQEFTFYRGFIERIREQRTKDIDRLAASFDETTRMLADRLEEIAEIAAENQRTLAGLTVSTEQVVRDAMRGYGGAVADRLPDVAPSDQAADAPREPGRAKQAGSRARGPRRRGNGPPPAG